MRNKNKKLIIISKGFSYLTRGKMIVITKWKVKSDEINMIIVCFKEEDFDMCVYVIIILQFYQLVRMEIDRNIL